MKRIISAFILLFLTAVIYISGLSVVTRVCDKKIKTLENSIELIEKNDTEKAGKKIKEVKLNRLTHYIYKTKIDDIEDTVNSAYFYLLENDKKESAVYIKKAIDLLDEAKKEVTINADDFF